MNSQKKTKATKNLRYLCDLLFQESAFNTVSEFNSQLGRLAPGFSFERFGALVQDFQIFVVGVEPGVVLLEVKLKKSGLSFNCEAAN